LKNNDLYPSQAGEVDFDGFIGVDAGMVIGMASNVNGNAKALRSLIHLF